MKFFQKGSSLNLICVHRVGTDSNVDNVEDLEKPDNSENAISVDSSFEMNFKSDDVCEFFYVFFKYYNFF